MLGLGFRLVSIRLEQRIVSILCRDKETPGYSLGTEEPVRDAMKKPVITYPCSWSYRIIGPSEQILRSAVSNVMGNKAHQVSLSNTSSGGKYQSVHLEVNVYSDEERLDIFNKLKNEPQVKFVL